MEEQKKLDLETVVEATAKKDNDLIDTTAREILEKYKDAFEELAK